MLIKAFLPLSISLSQNYPSPSSRSVTSTGSPCPSKHCSAAHWHLIRTEKHELPLWPQTELAHFTKYPACPGDQIFVLTEPYYGTGVCASKQRLLRVDLLDLILRRQRSVRSSVMLGFVSVSVLQEQTLLCCVAWKLCYC